MRPEALVGARRWTRRRTAALVVVIAAVAGAAWLALSRGGAATGPAYRTEPVSRIDLVVKVSAPGSLEVADAVPVPAPLAGTVVSVVIDEDQTVAAGQLLATLDTGGLDSDATRASAEARQAEARLAEARTAESAAAAELARAQKLRSADLVSDEQLERLTSDVARTRAVAAAAAAAVQGTRAGAAGARQRAQRAEVRAPAAGVVLRRDVQVGAAVSPDGKPLFVIAPRLDGLRLIAELDEADVGAVGPGATATFTVPAWPGRTFEATLVRVRTAPTRGDAGVSYGAILDAPNPDRALRPGMTAAVSLVVAVRPQALTVPEAALRWSPSGASGGRQRVYVLDGTGARAVPVKAGLSDGTRTEVEGDLTAGELVIVGVPRKARGGLGLGGGS
jgi:HlyD family secretion protein